jgi:hypothetical protein
MPLNPFNSDGSSLEHEDPIGSAVKSTVQSTNTQATTQVKAANQSFVDQLYGNAAPSGEDTDPHAAPNPATAQPQATPSAAAHTPAPEDQSKLDEARQKLAALQRLHNKNYVEPTFGEEAQRKRQQEEAQERQMKEQQDQEEEELKAQKKAQNDEEIASSSQGKSHGKGRNRMTQPVSVTQAKTKTEINRGSSG